MEQNNGNDMWGLFKRKKKQIVPQAAVVRTPSALTRKIQQVQGKWADWMQRKSERLSVKTKKTLLVLMVLMGTIYCGLLVISSFNAAPKITQERIKTMKLPVKERPNPDANGDAALRQRIAGYHRYLDSLNATAEGRAQLERLLKSRPGLLDSLQLLENLYKNQK